MLSPDIVKRMFEETDKFKKDSELNERAFSICEKGKKVTISATRIGGPESVPLSSCPVGSKRSGIFHTHPDVFTPSDVDRAVALTKKIEFQCVSTPAAKVQFGNNQKESNRDLIYCETYHRGVPSEMRVIIRE